jgi:hypothetical protein
MAQTTRSKNKGGAKATVDHEEIRRWVEDHGGKPAVVKSTNDGKRPGILRIDFPGFSGAQSLEEIAWDDWFERFESAKLAFLYQDQSGSGRTSRFNKLVSRDSVETQAENGREKRTSTRRSAKPSSAKRSSAKRSSAKRSSAKRSSAKRSSARTGANARGKRNRAETASGRGSAGGARQRKNKGTGATKATKPSRSQRAPARGSAKRSRARGG